MTAERDYIVNKLSVNEEVEELLLGFFDDVEDWADDLTTRNPDFPVPWGDQDVRLWALGFYFDPERANEADDWDLMECSESCPISLLQWLEEMGLTRDDMQPDRSVLRSITDLPSVWEGLKAACTRLAELEAT
jgi:hypothetical protein